MNRSSCLVLGLVLGLAACVHQGDGDIGNPFYRKAHWFSFVGGDDVAATCAAGGADHVRLVYNAIWEEQVRIYEWGGDSSDLRIRTIGSGSLTRLSLDDPLAPWRAGEVRVALDSKGRQALEGALDAAGGFGPPAIGLDLPSDGYYWAAASCRGGRFVFTGWVWPSDRFDAATFPALLFARDPGREDVRLPREPSFDPQRAEDQRRGVISRFLITVGATGRVR